MDAHKFKTFWGWVFSLTIVLNAAVTTAIFTGLANQLPAQLVLGVGFGAPVLAIVSGILYLKFFFQWRRDCKTIKERLNAPFPGTARNDSNVTGKHVAQKSETAQTKELMLV